MPEMPQADEAAHDQGTLGFFMIADVSLYADHLETLGLAMGTAKVPGVVLARQFVIRPLSHTFASGTARQIPLSLPFFGTKGKPPQKKRRFFRGRESRDLRPMRIGLWDLKGL
jgi:hypothetical protein